MRKLWNLRRIVALCAGSFLTLSAVAAPDRSGTDLQQLLGQLRSNAGDPLALTWSPGTQAYNFIRGNGASLLIGLCDSVHGVLRDTDPSMCFRQPEPREPGMGREAFLMPRCFCSTRFAFAIAGISTLAV